MRAAHGALSPGLLVGGVQGHAGARGRLLLLRHRVVYLLARMGSSDWGANGRAARRERAD